MIYAPLEEQPKQNLTREEMTEVCAQSHSPYEQYITHIVMLNNVNHIY